MSQMTVRVIYDKQPAERPSSSTVFATRGVSVCSAGIRLMQILKFKTSFKIQGVAEGRGGQTGDTLYSAQLTTPSARKKVASRLLKLNRASTPPLRGGE